MRSTRRNFLKAGLIIGSIAALDAFWFERTFFETNEYFLNKSLNHKNHIRCIQVSDLHLNSIGSLHRQLTKKLNDLKPDLIFFTGDAIDKAQNIHLLDNFLSGINPAIKKVAILGNWEYWGAIDLKELNRVYEKHHCDLLINQSKQYLLKSRLISVTGVDDFLGGNADIKSALKEFKQGEYHIVLNHCPQYTDHLKTHHVPIDLVLSGHTHGGQINMLGFIPFLPQGSGKYVKGWYQNANMNMYVSKGIGTSMLPIRFGARAEIAVFHI